MLVWKRAVAACGAEVRSRGHRVSVWDQSPAPERHAGGLAGRGSRLVHGGSSCCRSLEFLLGSLPERGFKRGAVVKPLRAEHTAMPLCAL